jgi:hypothetical protein
LIAKFVFFDFPTAPGWIRARRVLLRSRLARGENSFIRFTGDRSIPDSDAALGELAGAFPHLAASPEKYRNCPADREAQP